MEKTLERVWIFWALKASEVITYGLIRTQHTGNRSGFAYLVETLDHQDGCISRQRQDLGSVGFIFERFCQFVDELVQIEILGLELLRAGEGKYDI